MIAFIPLDLFREDPVLSAPWKDEARQKLFHEAATHALAKMALDGASAEELAGAKRFLILLLNAAEKVEAAPMAAPARLNYNVEAEIAARHTKKE